MMHVGLIMGDHSKTGINTMLNTGTTVGSSCNMFGNGFHPNHIPSFTWGGPDTNYTEYRLDKAIHVAEKVMDRRGVQMTADDKVMMQTVFDSTAEERTIFS